MPFASCGDTVKIHLTAQLKNGEVVYSTFGGIPFVYAGAGKAIARSGRCRSDGMAPAKRRR